MRTLTHTTRLGEAEVTITYSADEKDLGICEDPVEAFMVEFEKVFIICGRLSQQKAVPNGTPPMDDLPHHLAKPLPALDLGALLKTL